MAASRPLLGHSDCVPRPADGCVDAVVDEDLHDDDDEFVGSACVGNPFEWAEDQVSEARGLLRDIDNGRFSISGVICVKQEIEKMLEEAIMHKPPKIKKRAFNLKVNKNLKNF